MVRRIDKQSEIGQLNHDIGALDETYQVRGQPSRSCISDGLLGWFCLLFSADDRHQGNVDLAEIVSSGSSSQLPHGLDEGGALDVTDSPTKFDDTNIWLLIGVVHRDPRHPLDPILDGIGNMRDHLDGLAQIIALSLPVNDMLVHFAGCDAVFSCQGDVEVSFVVSQVKIDFTAIIQHKTFSVPKDCQKRAGKGVISETNSVGAMVPVDPVSHTRPQ